MYSKKEQLNKTKQNKKPSQTEYIKIVDFTKDISDEMCQIENCNKGGDDIHHPFGRRGINYGIITVVCRECHHIIHNGMDKRQREGLDIESKSIGRENRRMYDANQ